MCCDIMRRSYTKEIERILKVGGNVGFINQSMRAIEPRDCSSQTTFVKKSCDRLRKNRVLNNKYQIFRKLENFKRIYQVSEFEGRSPVEHLKSKL